MATNETYVGTSHNLLNYIGLLFCSGDTSTPFSTLIGGKYRNVQSWKFPTSLAYQISGGTAQPAITESASLTAPNAEKVTRTQNVNVCQIFQRQIKLSYAKLSSMDQLSGVAIAGERANPQNELDFQIAQALLGMRNDLEYVFLNGAYQDGTYDDVAYKTKGITAAISTNAVAAGSTALDFWKVAEVVEKIAEAGAPTDNLYLMARPVNIMQFNADAAANGLTIVPGGRNVNGLAIATIVTPFGEVGVVPNAKVASGTAIICNPAVCSPVYLDVPGKGNFFVESLGRAGAADAYQLYGQAGLDYGAEWYHGKITGLTTSFSAPAYNQKVSIVGTVTTQAAQ